MDEWIVVENKHYKIVLQTAAAQISLQAILLSFLS